MMATRVSKPPMKPETKRRTWLLKVSLSLIAWWVFLSCSFGWAWVQAAEEPKAPPQAGETKSALMPISASEIIPRAEQTLRSLRESRFQIAADSDAALNSLQKDIAALAARSDRRWQNEGASIGQTRSLQRLNDVLRDWSFEQNQLDSGDLALSRRSRELVEQENDVNQIIETWRAAEAASTKQALPKVALQKVGEVLREADAVRLLIRDAMAKLLNLQNLVADRREILANIRTDIDKARENTGRDLFVLYSLPLWEPLFYPEAQDVITAQAAASAQRFVDDLLEFLQRYRGRTLLHVTLFLVLVALFRFFRLRLAPESVERLGGASAILVLDRPFAASFLLALMASPALYPGAAGSILRIAVVPCVIPLLRLLPGLPPQEIRRLINLLVVMYLLDFVRYILPEAWLPTRFLLLLIATMGCVSLGFFLHLRRSGLFTFGSRERLVLPLIRLGFLSFVISAGSNIVGNMTLAEILVGAPVRIIYAAALIFASAHLLMTLAAVSLRSPPVNWLRSVRTHGELLASRCRTLIRLAAIIFWAAVSLYLVGVLGDLSAAVTDFLQFRWKVGAAEISVYGLTTFFAVIIIAVLVSRMLRFVLSEEIFPRLRLPRGVPGAVDVLSRYCWLLLGFLIALAAAGVDFSKVTLLISALGVGIGFGLQNLVNNFVSGLILVFEHPVQVGDYVEIGPLFGEVRKIGFRASVLRTPD